MILIPRSTQYVFVMVEIAPRDELGAPADPTNDRVSMAFSPTRSPDSTTMVFRGAQWQANTAVIPTKFYAMCAIGSATATGTLDEGVWWPVVRITSNPEIPDLIGEPFRSYGA